MKKNLVFVKVIVARVVLTVIGILISLIMMGHFGTAFIEVYKESKSYHPSKHLDGNLLDTMDEWAETNGLYEAYAEDDAYYVTVDKNRDGNWEYMEFSRGDGTYLGRLYNEGLQDKYDEFILSTIVVR